MSMVERIQAIKEAWAEFTMTGRWNTQDEADVSTAITAALAEAEKVDKKVVWLEGANELLQSQQRVFANRDDKRDAEWKRAREAWWKLSPLVSIMSAFDIEQANRLDQFFGGGEGTVNLDTNRVCPKCLYQYNDRVNHVCNDKEPK